MNTTTAMEVLKSDGETTVLLEVPNHFLCPLTLSIFQQPVVATTKDSNSCQHSFERSAITAWLRKNSTCPLTRSTLKRSDLQQNAELAAEIQGWKGKNDLLIEEDNGEVSVDDSDNSEDDDFELSDELLEELAIRPSTNTTNTYDHWFRLLEGEDNWMAQISDRSRQERRRRQEEALTSKQQLFLFRCLLSSSRAKQRKARAASSFNALLNRRKR